MSDYIPHPDADFGPWLTIFAAGCTAQTAQLGLTPAEAAAISDGAENWNAAYAEHLAKQTAAASAKQAKDGVRADNEALIRPAVAKIQANPTVNDAMKQNIGLPVYDSTPTRAPVPTTRPILVVDMSQRLQHKLTFRDESTPNTPGKPAGVREIEIWAKIGAPAPAGQPDCTFLGATSARNYKIDFQPADAGKPAHYMARWKNTRGEYGPWSETVIATIGA